MIRTMLKVLLLACFLPCFSWAAGLGELKVISALGQPLRAEIDLVSLEEGDARALEAHIAAADAFKRAGVEYNPLLPHVEVRLSAHPDGRPYILLSSSEIVNDPFLDLLIDLSWPKGQIEREYTLLFDPPELAKSPSVSPPVALHEKRLESMPSAPTGNEYGPVRRGETLGKIAAATKPQGVTLEQMLVALYQANESAFMDKNMNRLEAGKVLRVPEKKEIDSVSAHEADKVVKVQAADWNAYRQRLATGAMERGAGLKRSVSGKISSREEGQIPPQPKEVLKLSKGEASSPTASEEEKAAQVRTMNEASERILMLEKNIQEMKKLLALKNQALARASAPVAVKAPLKTSTPSILDNPVLLGAAGGVVVGLAAIALLISRRKKKHAAQGQPPLHAERIELGELEKPAERRAEPVWAEAPDPIEEAQVYFSYKRFAQAEEVLREALQDNPKHFEAYLLLMKVHAAAQEKDKLEAAARRLQAAEPSDEVWKKATEIGFAADPENPLYGGVEGGASQAAADFEGHPGESLDFDLDFDLGSEEAVDLQLEEEAEKADVDIDVLPEETRSLEEQAVDFDLSTMIEEPKEEAPPEEHAVDFDLSSIEVPREEALAEEEAVDFDLSAMEASAKDETSSEEVQKTSFDISDIPSLVESPRQATRQELPDIDLHLGEEPGEASGPKEPGWYEVATKLDLAKVYQEMGDHEGAREILDEVLNEGDSDQKATARAMLASLTKS